MRHVFVISDLHLGGRSAATSDGRPVNASQLCNAYDELVGFISWVADRGAEPGANVELVINGDFVDFLAEDPAGSPELCARIWTAEEAHAIAKLDRIISRPHAESRGVFEALCEFRSRGHRLTLLLGNHDVELALPGVRAHLFNRLGGESRGPLRFVYDGEAYPVGRILVEHGNRYDDWNMVNHSALRQERSVRSRGLPVVEEMRKERYFVPPPGTYLVIHFVNRIKARYRFVDLLKPEETAVVPLLLSLEPGRRRYFKDILAAAPVYLTKRSHGLLEPAMPKVPGDMRPSSHTKSRSPATLDDVLREALGGDAEPFLEGTTAGDMGIRRALRDFGHWFSVRREELPETIESASHWARLVVQERKRTNHVRLLHTALRHVNAHDDSFTLESEEARYVDAATRIATEGRFDVVVFGHTHLPKRKQLEVAGRDCWYFNTGTWCDVLRLPEDVHDTGQKGEAALESFLLAIGENDYSRYVKRYLTFFEALVGDDGRPARTSLHSYRGQGREREPPLESPID